jgi:hypothetical protein
MYHIFQKHGRKRPYTEKIRSFTSVNAPYTISVFRRISAYTITVKYERNNVTCNTAKFDRIRSVYNMDTVVYGVVYDRLLSYTESVTLDLGNGAKNKTDEWLNMTIEQIVLTEYLICEINVLIYLQFDILLSKSSSTKI